MSNEDLELQAWKAEATLARLMTVDLDLFDPDEDAEDRVYETYGSAGRRLRREFLKAVRSVDDQITAVRGGTERG
jgi:hypothetical protein